MADLETPHEDSTIQKDTTNTPSSEAVTTDLQDSPVSESPAVTGDIDESAVSVLPGTGGPDDVGDVEVAPEDLNMSGH